MTNEEIKQLPSIVDACLDDAILDEVRQDLNEKLDKVCQLAIQALEIPKNATNGDMIKTLFPSAEFELNSDWKKTNTGYLTFKGNGFSMCVYLEWWNAPYREGDAE